MKQFTADMGALLLHLAEVYPTHPMSDVTGCDPFKVLIACIMSLRTRDDTTMPLAEAFFQIADTPAKMAALSVAQIEKAIYPVGFYKTKAKNIKAICERLVSEFDSRVPDDIDTLLSFNGVGRKTANLVVGLGYDIPAVCVDVHVHRIYNRMGYLKTKTPEDTEFAIRKKLPKKYWNVLNRVLVRHGQDCCKPIGPMCAVCPIEKHCLKIDVKPKRTS